MKRAGAVSGLGLTYLSAGWYLYFFKLGSLNTVIPHITLSVYPHMHHFTAGKPEEFKSAYLDLLLHCSVQKGVS